MEARIDDLAKLQLPKEKRLFWILAVISAIFWIAAIATIFGIFVCAALALVSFFINGLFVARIKSESVEVTPEQLPELHQIFVDACDKVRMPTIPRLFIMQQGGWLNAFATRFARRNFVVLYSDLVEAYEPQSTELQFIIGHELGHIKQRHITLGAFVSPGMLIPLLGSAYSRARESTCDRYGTYVANDVRASMRAALALAGGKQLFRVMDPLAFARQHQNERGFFISLHELISTYPTMSKRVSDIFTFGTNSEVQKVSRNFFAYPVALIASPITIVLVYVAIISTLVFMKGDFANAFQNDLDESHASEGVPAALKGIWVTADHGLTIQVSNDSFSIFVKCEDESRIEAKSTAHFTGSNIVIEKSVVQNKEVGGIDCSAQLSAGILSYALTDEDELIIGEGENAVSFFRPQNT